MAITSLTQAEAQTRINTAEEAKNHARQLVQQMQDRSTTMTSSSWLGNQSAVFLQKMQGLTDDCTNILNRLDHIIETGKSNMLAAVNLDAE